MKVMDEPAQSKSGAEVCMTDEETIDLSIFLNEYLGDAATGFQKAGDALLAFEKDRGQVEKLDEVARVFHTLKSSSAMLEFDDIAGLAHCAEDILGRIRRDKMPASQEVVNILFETTDTLEKMVMERGGEIPEVVNVLCSLRI